MENKLNPKIHVLLSTYNGEIYLEQQILSILNQEAVEVILLIRDDGSMDATRDIIQKYSDHLQVILLKDFQHLGLPESYFELMRSLDFAKFIAFADQDDVWRPRHLITLYELLRDVDGIGMASTNRENGLHFKHSNWSKIKNRTWANALVENPHPGNCLMITGETNTLFKTLDSTNFYMHDSALYAICSLAGVVKHADIETIEYRIHSGNAIGVTRNTNPRKVGQSLKKFASQMSSLEPQLTHQVPSATILNIREFSKSLESKLFFHNIRYLVKPIAVRLRLRDDLYLRIFLSLLPLANRFGKWSFQPRKLVHRLLSK